MPAARSIALQALMVAAVAVACTRSAPPSPLAPRSAPPAIAPMSAATPRTWIERWRFKADAAISLAPAVGEGRVFAVSATGTLAAVDVQGRPLWSLPAAVAPPGAVTETLSTPPTAAAGLVLAGSSLGILRAFDAASGREVWKHSVGRRMLGRVAVLRGEAGSRPAVIALSQPDGVVQRFDLATGEPAWTSAAAARSDGSPAVAAGRVVLGDCASELRVLAADSGEALARVAFEAQGPVAAGVSVEGDLAFAGTRNGSLVCVDVARGAVVWTQHPTDAEAFTTPLLTADRVIYGAQDGAVLALRRSDGALLWRFAADDAVQSPLRLGEQIAVAAGGHLYLLRLADGTAIWSSSLGDRITEPVAMGDGVVVGTDEGFLVAYGPPPR